MSSYGTVAPGRRIRQERIGGFVITETAYAPLARLRPHVHPQPSLTFVVEGGFHERIGSNGAELGPASLLIKPGDVEHGDDIGTGGARILFIEPTPEGHRDVADLEPLFGRITHAAQERIGHLGWRLCSEPWDRDPASRLMAEGLVLEMLALVLRASEQRAGAPPDWLRRMRDRLAAEFVRPPSITALAVEAGVHPSYAARAFGRCYGVRPGEFLQQRRLDAAIRALVETDRPLAEIAVETGFADQSHFGRIFKRHVGTTPARYRRRMSGIRRHSPAPA